MCGKFTRAQLAHQIFLSKLHFSFVQLSVARFLGDLAHFKGPKILVGRFSVGKKHFIINTIAISKVCPTPAA
jgi:hypothetical protein